ADAIGCREKALGATELFGMDPRDGKTGHDGIKIGDSPRRLSDEFPEMGHRGPQSLGGSPVSIMLYVEDVDAVVNRATIAGAKLDRPVEDKFYGDRAGSLTDPFGHIWHIGTHKEDISPEEMEKRAAAAAGK